MIKPQEERKPTKFKDRLKYKDEELIKRNHRKYHDQTTVKKVENKHMSKIR